MRRVAATRYVTPLREGGSLPALVEADDDGLYVLKFRGAGQGPKALVAEVVVGELARALGFPVPELVLVELDATIGRAEPDPEIQDLLLASDGLNLGVDFLPGALPFSPAAGPGARPGLRRRRRLARRARDERRPHRAEPEPALVARPAVADRPWSRALLPPRRRRRARARPRPLRGSATTTCCCLCVVDRRGRRAARLARDATTCWSTRSRRSRSHGSTRAGDEDYVDYLGRRLEAPRGFVEEAESARG